MIEIIMKTNNGSKYLPELLNSIFAQYYKDFHLTIFDADSTDNTIQIIRNYIIKYPDRINLYTHQDTNLKRIIKLLNNCDTDYFAICHQNDVLRKDRLLMQMREMKKLEEVNGKDTPLLVFSDIQYVSNHLVPFKKAFSSFSRNTADAKIERLLAESFIFDNACLFNKITLDYAPRIPEKATDLGWWLGMIALSFGEISFYEEPLVLSRQDCKDNLLRQNKIDKSELQKTYKQAKTFLEAFCEDLPSIAFKKIDDYSNFSEYSKIYRISGIISKGYKKTGIKKLVGQIMHC